MKDQKNQKRYYNRELFHSLQTELERVLNELKVLQKEDITESLYYLDADKREELFHTLKEFISKKRARQSKAIIEELHKYRLLNEDTELLGRVEELLSKRNYKEIIEIL